jgi:hypothetical protein
MPGAMVAGSGRGGLRGRVAQPAAQRLGREDQRGDLGGLATCRAARAVASPTNALNPKIGGPAQQGLIKRNAERAGRAPGGRRRQNSFLCDNAGWRSRVPATCERSERTHKNSSVSCAGGAESIAEPGAGDVTTGDCVVNGRLARHLLARAGGIGNTASAARTARRVGGLLVSVQLSNVEP